MGSQLLPSGHQNEVESAAIGQTGDSITTLKEQYKKVLVLEEKCIWLDKKRPQSTVYLPRRRWEALLAIHKHLLHEHEKFFSLCQTPSASATIRDLPHKYTMFDRMGRYGIFSLVKLLYQSLPGSSVHLLHFADYASKVLKRFLVLDPALGVMLFESLGDVARCCMAVERLYRKQWADISRYWYHKAADRNPSTGRIQHSLAVLSHYDPLQKLFHLMKALLSVQPLPIGHARLTIDAFFGHWNALPLQSGGMVSHFVVAHGVLFTNGPRERLETLANEFMSLLPMHIRRPRSQNQHEVYIMSCNIASLFGYSTYTYKDIADLLSREQSRGIANASTSARSQADAIYLTFRTLSILLQYSGFPNAVSGIYISLVFLWCASVHPSVMERLEAQVPWQAITGFLNSLLSQNMASSMIEDDGFPFGNYGKTPQLPEDFLIRGQVWSQLYYPDNFFEDVSGYGQPVDEIGSEEVVRKHRCLWLGVQLTKLGRWMTYSPTRTKRFQYSFAKVYGH